MKFTKRIIALLLALIITASVPMLAFADAEEAEQQSQSFSLGANKVADIYLLISTANPKIPHMWIYIVNTSDKTLTVGHYKLPAGEAVSMGAWKDRGMGAGIHYNMERYWVKEETYNRTIYIKGTITESELSAVTSTINRHNYWNWGLNCAWFASCVWNSANIKIVPYLLDPYFMAPFMYLYGAKKLDFTISKCTNYKQTYKHTDEGLKTLYPSVLYTSTGV